MEKVIVETQQALRATLRESKVNAVNLPSNIVGEPSVGAVLIKLIRHPVEHLIRRWNWKSAVLSSLLRGAIFSART